jgi:hypothetical protein
MCCLDEQEWLISMVDINDLLALRLVSPKTKEWVDAIISKIKIKSFTLFVNETNNLD